MHKDKRQSSRRKFIKQTAMGGTGLMLANPLQLFSQNNKANYMSNNIKSKGYAATGTSAILTPWSFERRPLGDDDVLIDVKFYLLYNISKY